MTLNLKNKNVFQSFNLCFAFANKGLAISFRFNLKQKCGDLDFLKFQNFEPLE